MVENWKKFNREHFDRLPEDLRSKAVEFLRSIFNADDKKLIREAAAMMCSTAEIRLLALTQTPPQCARVNWIVD